MQFNKHYIHDLVDFLEENKITTAYSDLSLSQIGTYFSGWKINISQFSSNPQFNLIEFESFKLNNDRFAILATDDKAVTYQNYLKEKEIEHKTAIVSEYKIFWDFSGNDIDVNNLRTLIPY